MSEDKKEQAQDQEELQTHDQTGDHEAKADDAGEAEDAGGGDDLGDLLDSADGEDGETQDSADEGSGEDGETQGKPRKGSARERIRQLAAEKKQMQGELAELKAQRAQAEEDRKLAAEWQKVHGERPDVAPSASEPQMSDYDDFNKYRRDLKVWKSAGGGEKAQAAGGDDTDQERGEQFMQALTEDMKAINARLPKGREVTAQAVTDLVKEKLDGHISQDNFNLLAYTSNPVRMIHHLANNPESVARLESALKRGGNANLVEFGKLEAEVAAGGGGKRRAAAAGSGSEKPSPEARGRKGLNVQKGIEDGLTQLNNNYTRRW